MIALRSGPTVFAVEDRGAQLTWRRVAAGPVRIVCGPVDLMVESGFGFLMLPPHDFDLPSTAATIEYIIDDAVDYRRNGYEVVVVSVQPGYSIAQMAAPFQTKRGDLVKPAAR